MGLGRMGYGFVNVDPGCSAFCRHHFSSVSCLEKHGEAFTTCRMFLTSEAVGLGVACWWTGTVL